MFTLDKEQARDVLLGGALMGAGGGGLLPYGLETLETVFSLTDKLTVLDSGDLADDDIVISTAMVGAPSTRNGRLDPMLWKKALAAFQTNYDGPIHGIAANELGAFASSNGWVLSVLTGIPVYDAPCVPRAVPYSPMCCLGLDMIPGYESLQSACRGSSEQEFFTICCRGELTEVTAAIRSACSNAQGASFGVIRNPVSAKYHREHAAPGSTRLLLKLGSVIRTCQGDAEAVCEDLVKEYGFTRMARGFVSDKKIDIVGGYDIGSFSIDGKEIVFWNEYMLMEEDGRRLVTFPDTLVTIDAESGMPVTSAEMRNGQDLIVLSVDAKKLPGPAVGLHTEKYMREIEKAAGREIVRYYRP